VNDELSKQMSHYERLNLLYQVSNVIHSTLEPQDALQLIVNEAVRLMRASSGSVVLINPTTGFLEIHASANLRASAMSSKTRVMLLRGAACARNWPCHWRSTARCEVC
jgi:GAF domain-containing protein